MKRLVALISLMLFAAYAHADMIVPRVTYDFPGSKTFKAGSQEMRWDIDGGFSLGAEYLHPINDRFTVGGGFQYLFDRKFKDVSPDATFTFLPVYVTGQFFPFQDMKEVMPYAKANLGYNVIYDGNKYFKGNAALTGGYYWALGLGARFLKDFTADITYSAYHGEAKLTRTTDTEYTALGLNIGYVFDMK